jgi:hypothetical protein
VCLGTNPHLRKLNEGIGLISGFDAPLTTPIVRNIIRYELFELNYAN